MRIVMEDSQFVEMLASAKRESLSSFKNDAVLVEKYITRPRHIEFQVYSYDMLFQKYLHCWYFVIIFWFIKKIDFYYLFDQF